MNNLIIAIIWTGVLGTLGLAIALVIARKQVRRLASDLRTYQEKCTEFEQRFSPVLDAQEEAKLLLSSAEAEKAEAARETVRLKSEAEALRQQYSTAFQRYQKLTGEVSSLEEDLENVAVGLYKPHFSYVDSENYKNAINMIRGQQKTLISSGLAIRCEKEWTVGGDRRAGERMIKDYE